MGKVSTDEHIGGSDCIEPFKALENEKILVEENKHFYFCKHCFACRPIHY